MSLEPLNVKFTSDTSGFSKGLNTVEKGLKQVTSGVSNLIKTAAGLGGVALGIKGLADSFKAFTALESNMSRISDIFGAAAVNIQAFAQGSAKAFGLAESAAYEYAAIYGNLFRSITSGATENTAVTIKMLQASAVVASKTGRTMEDVMDRIRSGLLGNTEAIEDLGINVNVSMLEMTDAFKRIADGRSWNQLNFYEQQQIRTLGILEQAHKSFGDEVQQGTAFSLSILSSAFKDLMSTAGSFISVVLAPIIQALTTIVQLANTALKGLSALLGFNATLNTDSLAAGSANAEGMAEGLDESTAAAKKLNQQLAGFDQFNDITKTESGGKNTSAAAAGGAGGMGVTMDFEEIHPPDTTWADKLLAWAESFSEIIAPLKTALDALLGTLKEIGGFAWQGLVDFYERFLKPVGTWVLGTGLPRLVTALKDGLQKVDWTKINTAFSKLWEALSPFAVHVGEGLLWLWETVLMPLGTWALDTLLPAVVEGLAAAVGLLDSAAKAIAPGLAAFVEALKPIAEWAGEKLIEAIDLGKATLDGWGQWFTDHQDTFLAIGEALGKVVDVIWSMLEPLADAAWEWFKDFWADLNTTVQDLVGDALEWLVDALNDLSKWMEENKTLIEDVAVVIGSFAAAWGLVNAAITVWNAISGVATAATTAFGAAVNFLTSPIGIVTMAIGALITIVVLLAKHWDEVKEIAAKAWDGIKRAWNVVATWFDDHVVTPIANFFGSLWDGIKTGASVLADFIQDYVIDPIVKAFKWLYNSVVGIIEGVINAFIGIINGFIRGINWVIEVINEIPGISLGIIPELGMVSVPRLAKGGMAYGEVQAIVGDNPNSRQDPEVISPLSRLQEMFTAAMIQRDIAGGANGETVIKIVLEDGTVIAEFLIDPMNKVAKNLGYAQPFRAEMA